jgi:hypothetical protein
MRSCGGRFPEGMDGKKPGTGRRQRFRCWAAQWATTKRIRWRGVAAAGRIAKAPVAVPAEAASRRIELGASQISTFSLRNHQPGSHLNQQRIAAWVVPTP